MIIKLGRLGGGSGEEVDNTGRGINYSSYYIALFIFPAEDIVLFSASCQLFLPTL